MPSNGSVFIVNFEHTHLINLRSSFGTKEISFDKKYDGPIHLFEVRWNDHLLNYFYLIHCVESIQIYCL